MRVLIVFHGWFPQPGRPVAGGALRAWHHAEALRAAGHDVHLVTRDQDRTPGGPPTFSGGASLCAHAAAVRPDAILCVQPEEAPHLGDLDVPLVVDLYAPRLLEAQFQDPAGPEAVVTLEAVRAGDWFLFSNERQRWYWLGILALAGVDCRTEPGAVVPLVAPEGPARRAPREPTFVMGGVAWPWIDVADGLARAVAHLERRGTGRVVVYGQEPVLGTASVVDLPARVPPGPRLEYAGVLPYDDLLGAYARATAALDLAAPTPERSLAVAFRHMDYLGCGLPMVVGPDHPLGHLLAETGAGFVGPDVEAALDQILDDARGLGVRSRAARELGRTRFSREACEAPLLRWLEAPRTRSRLATPLGDLARALARAEAAEVARAALAGERDRVVAEVGEKRAEVARLVEQVQRLVVTGEHLAGAVAEVAGFKREAVAVLDRQGEVARREARDLAREVAVLRADVAKKSAEILAMEGERQRLENDLHHAREELERARSRGLFKR